MLISLPTLESHLWESANILRGPVDAADFKTYIFPLLFFKRICDVLDEEYQEIVDETRDEQLAYFPESHRFQIPEDCHWNDVRTKATNVGTALKHVMYPKQEQDFSDASSATKIEPAMSLSNRILNAKLNQEYLN